MPGLDGLRALSVLAVIAYHLDLGWAPGGLLGVGVFFVLSGYLITDQLLSEWRRSRRIDLAGFWIRRARRLLPAMLLMLACTALWLLLFDRSRLTELQGDFVSAALYFHNWWLIFHEVSYFESFGPPSPIGHLWSLAIEEQFYLLWPPLLILGVRVARRRGGLIALLLAGALVSAAAMALLYVPGLDPSRVYYGTDTRVFALLIGAALAAAWPSDGAGERIPRRFRTYLDAAGAISLAAIVWMIATTGEYDGFLYEGGLALLSVLSALTIAALTLPSGLLAFAFGSKPLKWIGVRSYSLYIWHYPVIALTSPSIDTGGPEPVRVVLQLAASFVLASLSWKYVEEPIRRGALREWRKRLRTSPESRRKASAGIALCAVCLLAVSFNGAILKSAATMPVYADGETASEHPSPERPPEATGGKTPAAENTEAFETSRPLEQPRASESAEPSNQPDSGEAEATKPPKPTDKPDGSKPGASESSQTPEQSGALAPPESPNQPDSGETEATKPPKPTDKPGGSKAETSESPEPSKQPDTGKGEASKPPKQTDKPDRGQTPPPKPVQGAGKGITAIGDSVLLDAAPYLEKLLPGIFVDGKIGRQMTHAQEVVEAMIASGSLGDRIVIELGTNGSFNSKQLVKLIETIGDERDIWLVNVRVPRKWQDNVNSALKKAAGEYDNVKLVDWYSASKGQDDFFYKDGVHLKNQGAEFYASLLAKELSA
ncbi:acyltransferase family protein [Cohnella cellulosilytica]|uniref:Acyltransferase family protein n=2 Tax=Cohnella cellulosilytica TaxID=986710 RepID=A0ABW2F177_9BACL